jgi:GrpB-like predicted nucleotidyltransferase (UPF0157 family)
MKNDDPVPIDPVPIQDYDPAWPDSFSKLATAVKAALGSLVVSVEHIGSTAVPGLAAKPAIDLDVVLASPADLTEAIRLLATIGYLHEGDLGVAGREAFRSPAGKPRHHLYVLSAGARKLDAVEHLRARLSADLLAAMKERDKPKIDTLRCLLAVLDNAGAQDPKAFGSATEVPRKSLTHNELQALMQAELASRRAAVIEYERGGRHQDAARLRMELNLLRRYIAS